MPKSTNTNVTVTTSTSAAMTMYCTVMLTVMHSMLIACPDHGAVHAAVSVHTVAGAMSSAQPGHTWMLVAAVHSACIIMVIGAVWSPHAAGL